MSTTESCSNLPRSGSPIDLPLDVILQIIPRADRPTLLAISATSRQFVAPARRLLFEVVKLGQLDDEDDLYDFLDLISCENNSISPAIRTLRIGNIPSTRSIYCPRERDDAKILASRLTLLNSIELYRIHCSDDDTIPPTLLQMISYLSVQHVLVEDALLSSHNLVNFIRHLPKKMRHLTLIAVRCNDTRGGVYFVPGNAVEDVFRNLSKLKHVTTDTTSLLIFFGVANSKVFDIHAIVRTFHLGLRSYPEGMPGPLSFCRRFLERAGPNINKLCIDLNYTDFNDEAETNRASYAEVNLSKCTNLTSVGVGVFVTPSGDFRDLEAVWPILKLVPAHNVRVFTMIIDFRWMRVMPVATVKDFPWIETAQRIRSIFPSVKSLKFTFNGWPKNDEVEVVAASIADRIRAENRDVDMAVEAPSGWVPPFGTVDWRTHWRDL